MLSQVVYETNADWLASQESMVKNDLVMVDVTVKGLLWFRFKKNRTVFLLSPLGKLQVKWSDESEKRTLFRLIKELLVAKPNEKLLVRPLKQQTWIEYPVPNSFKVYWCDEASEFVLKTPVKNKEGSTRMGKGASVGGGITGGSVDRFRARRASVQGALKVLRHELR